MKKANEREIAVYALMDITLGGGYNNLTLQKTLNKNDGLSRTQKAFITELVNGVLRNKLLIDSVIDRFSNTKTTKMKPLILNILRVSVYQLRWLDKTPDFAVLNEAVMLTRAKGFANLTGFVNGVLRTIARNPDIRPSADFSADTGLDYGLSAAYSYPAWLTERFLDYFDGDAEKTERLYRANSQPPRLTVCANTLKTTPDALTAALRLAGVTVAPGRLSPLALNLSGTSNITKLEAFQQGLFHVMDESAMVAVHMLNPQKGQTMIDLCSAPGGKAFMAAYLAQNGCAIHAVDLYAHKIALIEQSARRLGLDGICAARGDATVFNEAFAEKADVLLVDAPCSGLGLLRKKPDIKYTKTNEDILRLAQLQKEILSVAWRYVKKGGALLYSTCTLTKEENEENVRWFLDRFPFGFAGARHALPGGGVIGGDGAVTILPYEYDTDGFFIACLKRDDR